jgi:hypothetical protein
MHDPPGVPPWFGHYHPGPQDYLHRDQWIESLPHCRGLYTLSRRLRDWLADRVPVPVESLIHPAGTPNAYFDPSRYLQNPRPRLVQVGGWLRRYHSVYRLHTTRLQKAVIHLRRPWFDYSQRMDLQALPTTDLLDTVEEVPYLTPDGYDRLLAENIVFLDLYDSSANNAIIECIVRGTPVVVNHLDAVVEYLGADYPLYFDSLTEAAAKAENNDLVLAAHAYLMNSPIRPQLTGEHFLRSVAESEIYQALQTEGRPKWPSLPHPPGAAS